MKEGIDISYYQTVRDAKKVKADGIEFVILRSSYRTSVDKKFFSHVEAFRKVGIPIYAVYHFSYALTEKEAVEEAKLAMRLITQANLSKSTRIAFDFEYDTVEKAKQKGVYLTKDECNRHTIAFCEEVLKNGYKPIIYTNIDYYKNWYKKETLSRYDIWLADYKDDLDFPCLIRQYTSKGKISGISGNVDRNVLFEEDFKMKDFSRKSIIELAQSWIGKNEKDGSYKEIIDIYNSFTGPLPRGVKMLYSYAWCACTWSALAIKLGYTDIIPIEISCGELIKQAKNMGVWNESDDHIPKIGDAVLYDWQDSGIGDNTAWPDHVGIVEYVNEKSGYFTVIEGNYDDSVKKRTVSINGKYIRGFITPKYTLDDADFNAIISGKDLSTVIHEVIAGAWGNGENRKNALTANGYNYDEVQKGVTSLLNTPKSSSGKVVKTTCKPKTYDPSLSGDYITTEDLYCRNDAGTNKKALCLIPKSTVVNCTDWYTDFNGVKWLRIDFVLKGITYVGFSSSKYLKRV